MCLTSHAAHDPVRIKCQIADGGFVYKLGDAVSMKEGTAGGVATLGLMQKFDFPVMIQGYKFLLRITPATISAERFPYYGHFYGCMAMRLLGLEYKDDKDFRENTAAYIAEIVRSGIEAVPARQWEAAAALGLIDAPRPAAP